MRVFQSLSLIDYDVESGILSLTYLQTAVRIILAQINLIELHRQLTPVLIFLSAS